MNRGITVGGRIVRRTARRPEEPGAPNGLEDILWAATEIPRGPYAALARRLRRHLPAAAGGLAGRIQRARILALFHRATDEERMTILACLDGTVRRSLYPVMVSDDPRLVRIVDLVFDALEKEVRP